MRSGARLLVSNSSGYPVHLPPHSDLAAHLDAVRAAGRAQAEAGADIVTPGQIGQPHPAAPLVAGLEGIAEGRSRQHVGGWGEVARPLLSGFLRWREPIFAREVEALQEIHSGQIKVSLAGPYTLASLLEDPREIYDSFGGRIDACAQALAHEVRTLAALGVAVVQVEEPLISDHPSDFPRLREGMITLSEAKGSALLALMLTGDGLCPLYDWLQSLPVDVLGLDLIHSPGLVPMIGDRQTSRILALGVVDVDTVALETDDQVHGRLDVILTGVSAPEVHVQPAGSLGRLSPEAARQKLENLAGIVSRYRP